MDTDITATPAFRAAEVYEQFFVPGIMRYWTPLLLQRAAPKPGERVLDVACGTGVVARAMVPLVGPEGKVTGLDINPAMLAVACRQFSDHCDEIDWQEGQAEELPFHDAVFDLVTCQHGLQFFKDKPAAAAEMRRVLREGGRAVVEVWQSVEHNPFYDRVLDAIAAAGNVPVATVALPYSFGDPEALRGLLVDAGFGSVIVEPVRHDVRFEDPARFVELTIKGAAAVMPAYAQLYSNEQTTLYTDLSERLSGHIQAHTRDGVLTFPLAANIATAVR